MKVLKNMNCKFIFWIFESINTLAKPFSTVCSDPFYGQTKVPSPPPQIFAGRPQIVCGISKYKKKLGKKFHGIFLNFFFMKMLSTNNWYTYRCFLHGRKLLISWDVAAIPQHLGKLEAIRKISERISSIRIWIGILEFHIFTLHHITSHHCQTVIVKYLFSNWLLISRICYLK
jgi:hypothetical protein